MAGGGRAGEDVLEKAQFEFVAQARGHLFRLFCFENKKNDVERKEKPGGGRSGRKKEELCERE